MVQSKAGSVEQYLKELEPERRAVIKSVRECLLENLQEGFQEVMNWGMIAYEISLTRFPTTYNKKPILYCSLAAQKRHYGLYLMNVYSGSTYLEALQRGYHAAGLKLDMGKCCVRFRNLESIHLPTIGQVVASCSVEDFINIYESCRKRDSKP